MSELPVNKKDYDYAVLITDFITKLKNYNSDKTDKYEFKFIPAPKGYVVVWNDCFDEYKIILKRSLFNNVVIRKLKNGKSDCRHCYRSRTVKDNEYIISEIL